MSTEDLQFAEVTDEKVLHPKKKKKRKDPVKQQIERDYLLALAKKVTPSAWNKIVARAIEQAADGDYRAREWIARFVLPKDMTILEVVADERPTTKIVKDFVQPIIKGGS